MSATIRDSRVKVQVQSSEHHILQAKTALPGDPLSLATLLNYNRERRRTSVARIITGCECFLMWDVAWRTSLDF